MVSLNADVLVLREWPLQWEPCVAAEGGSRLGGVAEQSSCDVQEAGISVKLAPTIGIAVDHRRRNRSLESLQVGPRPP